MFKLFINKISCHQNCYYCNVKNSPTIKI